MCTIDNDQILWRTGVHVAYLVHGFMRPVLTAGLLFAGVTLWGCGIMPVVEQVPVPNPKPLSELLQTRPLLLDRVVFDIPRGTVVGENRMGNACFRSEEIKWNGNSAFRDGQYHEEFERVVIQYNYRLLEKPTSLFERYKLSGAELILGARITNLKENHCSGLTGWNLDRGHFKGNVRFLVHWEVFSVAQQKVVQSVDIEASAQVEEFTPVGENNYYVTAFGNAVKGLLANANFHKVVTYARENADPA
ncbi:MAG: hypothetical protein A4E19_08110 [Nitrospira sp. SG-bin1]|nr:MAG: hypothetical protein A4E19_08110 [Nitrospira sp. SG-bin1]